MEPRTFIIVVLLVSKISMILLSVFPDEINLGSLEYLRAHNIKSEFLDQNGHLELIFSRKT